MRRDNLRGRQLPRQESTGCHPSALFPSSPRSLRDDLESRFVQSVPSLALALASLVKSYSMHPPWSKFVVTSTNLTLPPPQQFEAHCSTVRGTYPTKNACLSRPLLMYCHVRFHLTRAASPSMPGSSTSIIGDDTRPQNTDKGFQPSFLLLFFSNTDAPLGLLSPFLALFSRTRTAPATSVPEGCSSSFYPSLPSSPPPATGTHATPCWR
ncbi:hypothetical protein LZ30DRAFT_480058 [Colletotrichum cereale]|nr:hypothetical protein LZ30DRAFT_480058 [Colletotrichum cereale]